MVIVEFSKSIIQFDLEGNFIKEWHSITKAGESLNINKSDISKCCRSKLNKAGNFQWCFKGNESTINKYIRLNIPHPNSKSIIQYDLEGNIIKEWNSITEAGYNLNIKVNGIRKCCKGERNTSHGFKWQYA